VEGSVCCLFWDMSKFSWRDWAKPRESQCNQCSGRNSHQSLVGSVTAWADLRGQLEKKVPRGEHYSLTIDESTDVCNRSDFLAFTDYGKDLVVNLMKTYYSSIHFQSILSVRPFLILFIHQWLYSPLLGPGLFFSSIIIFTHTVGLVFLHTW
jgi:hypothetical protein